MSVGTWFCPVCGALEERLTYFGFTVDRWPPERRRELEVARRYARWCSDLVPLPHAHDWIPTSCHSSYSRVSCAPTVHDSLFHGTLPTVPDGEIARSLVERLAAAPPERRRAMLMDFNSSESGPFAELVKAPLSREAFAAAYPGWLAEHRLWR